MNKIRPDAELQNKFPWACELIEKLQTRASIRRTIPSRKSVQNNEPDRLADLLDDAADEIYWLIDTFRNHHVVQDD